VYTSRALHTTLCGPWSLVLLKRSEKDENPNGEKERERDRKKKSSSKFPRSGKLYVCESMSNYQTLQGD
jgi:hypothetical protein